MLRSESTAGSQSTNLEKTKARYTRLNFEERSCEILQQNVEIQQYHEDIE